MELRAYKCPNCGAPADLEKSRCGYCGSFLTTERSYIPAHGMASGVFYDLRTGHNPYISRYRTGLSAESEIFARYVEGGLCDIKKIREEAYT